MSANRYAFFKGKILPVEQAKVSIMTHAFNYGTGCFEGIRAYWNREEEELLVFRLQEHYQRLINSARLLLINLPYSVDTLCELTLELLRKEGYREDAYLRPLAYKSEEIIGVKLHDLAGDFALFAVPFGKYIEKPQGCKAGVSSWRRIDDNSIPARGKITGGYVNSAFAKTEAMQNGFDEAIVLNQDGHISEGSAENLMMVRGGELITTPVYANILEGITRSTLKRIAKEYLNMEVVERQIDRTELYLADEIFFCGTGVEVVPVVSVDHRPVGSGKVGPVGQRVRDLYFRIVRGQEPAYRHWCSPVYQKAAQTV